MHAAKCVLDLNRNDIADNLDFELENDSDRHDSNWCIYKTYTKQSHTKASETSKKGSEKQSYTKQSKTI